MIDLQATKDDVVDALADALRHDDEPAVRALLVELSRIDRRAAAVVASSTYFWSWWMRDYRQRWIA